METGDNRCKSTKKSAYLGPLGKAVTKETPMTATNVYNQVRGTLNLAVYKKKVPEPTPKMTDLLREIQEGNKEARMWATRAMIEHYPDQYVVLHKE